jgi:hypothetical protein
MWAFFEAGLFQRRNATMLKLYGFLKVHPATRGHARDLRLTWALEEMQLQLEPAGSCDSRGARLSTLHHGRHDVATDEHPSQEIIANVPLQ